MPVVPEGQGLRHLAMDVDVAVAVGLLPPGERVGQERAPHLRPDEAVDVELMLVLEHDHRARTIWFHSPVFQSACSSCGVFS